MRADEESIARGRRWIAVISALVIISAPIALGIETAIRLAVAPPIFGRMRVYLRPTLTLIAWAFVGLTALAAILGGRLASRQLPRVLAESATRPTVAAPPIPWISRCPAAARAVLDRLMILCAIPQVPAIAATLLFMFGSELRPVLVAMAASSAGVAVQTVIAVRGYSEHEHGREHTGDHELARPRASAREPARASGSAPG
ncbi:MAG: hypothetical protein KC468_05845 [Myxococcales bacterium]|nr:hypothetical protein [Myxococcales bacterium]